MKRAAGVTLFILLALLILSLNTSIDVKKGLILLAFAASFWIFEVLPLPVTALSIPVLGVLLGCGSVKEAFASFAHPIIFLFLGGFALAAALSKFKLDTFIAYKVVSLSKGSGVAATVLLFAATAFISMWISNTSTTAMMLPLALGIVGAASDERLKSFVLLGVAYSASVGGIGTLVGSPPNGITAADLGMGFVDWLKFGLPTVLVLFPLLYLVLVLYFRPRLSGGFNVEPVDFSFRREHYLVFVVFLFAVLGWLFSKPLSHLLGISKGFDALVAVSAVILLFAFGLLNWRELEEGTDWGTLYLFGGGIALSHFLKTTGASSFIAREFVSLVGGFPLFLLILSVSLFMIFMTELMSNTATAAIFVPILISASKGLGVSPLDLAMPAGIAASCAFMLPVATPPNAIVYGTGFIRQRDMLRVGLALNLLFAFVIAVLVSFLVRVYG
ncbi:SLC13 family permease [Thermovibrio ammonificans]